MPDFINSLLAPRPFNLENFILSIFITFILSIIISITYMKTCIKEQYSRNFMYTLVMVPPIVALIIMLIGSNVARAFSLAGAFSIIRFRSNIGNPKHVSFVFFSLAAGLASGAGLHFYSVFFTLTLCLFIYILCRINYGKNRAVLKSLKISIPEDLNYKGVFDDIFEAYTNKIELKKVQTASLGTLYELIYTVSLKDTVNEKKFLDSIKSRNGNLDITLSPFKQKYKF